MDKNEKVDLRVVKTQLAIRNAFIALLEEKEFRDIQVQEIIERALINRSTFYKYYSGKSDLAGKLIADFWAKYQAVVQQHFESNNLRLFMQRIANEVEQQGRLMLVLWKINTKRHHLRQDMEQILQQAFLHHAKQLDPHKNWDYHATMFATLALASNHYFFTQGKGLPPPQLFDMWQEMVDVVKER